MVVTDSGAEIYHGPPSALRFMPRAFLPRPSTDLARPFPDLRLASTGFDIHAAEHRALLVSCGIGGGSDDAVRVLLPHIFGFRLSMALLTHPRWPLPIWHALQVRNRFLLHGPPATVMWMSSGARAMLNQSPSGLWPVLM